MSNEQGKTKQGRWYTEEQAATGAKTYAQACAPCHGANLESGAGPTPKGASWQQLYGGAKLLTVWGEIKGPMAQYAGTTFANQQSLNLLAYLLQQNGLPAGKKPLADTRTLRHDSMTAEVLGRESRSSANSSLRSAAGGSAGGAPRGQ